MSNTSVGQCAVAAVFALVMASSVASAQATRTWVSGTGNDADPCNRVMPCKTFAGAIAKTAPGGEIDAVDAGAYGTIAINKPITINGGPNAGGILNSGTTGITINAGPNDVVVIRNLSIQGGGTGASGITVTMAGAVHVENCVIFNQLKTGIDFEPTNQCRLYVTDTVIRDNKDPANGGGILLKPGVGGSARAYLKKVQLDKNTYGLRVEDNSIVSARDCSFSSNDTHGVVAIATAANVTVSLEDCSAAKNASSGLRAVNANAKIQFSTSRIDGNAIGLDSVFSGKLISFSNNRVGGNTTDGVPTGTIALK